MGRRPMRVLAVGALIASVSGCAATPVGFDGTSGTPCLSQVRAGQIETASLSGGMRLTRLAKGLEDGQVAVDGNRIFAISGSDFVVVDRQGQVLLRQAIVLPETLRSVAADPGGRFLVLSGAAGSMLHLDLQARRASPLGAKGFNPRFDSAGVRLAFDNGSDVFVLDVSRQKTRHVAAGTEPSWFPDSARLAVRTSKSQVDVVTIDTGYRERLLSHKRGVSVPRWSPDGQWMMYLRQGARSWRAELSLGAATEPRQVMVRRLADGAEASVGEIAKGNPGNFEWVTNAAVCQAD